MTTARITWQNIPGYFDFDDLYSEAIARAPDGARFVEIGVMFGRSSLYMAEAIRASGKAIFYDAVDVFGWGTEGLLKGFDDIMAGHTQELAVDVPPTLRAEIAAGVSHETVVRTLFRQAGLDGFVNIVASTGQARAASYADGSLDFVFIDAQHGYQDTVELLRAYLPKVKAGGVLAGHDFTPSFPGVLQAVKAALGDGVPARRSSFWFEKGQ